MATQIPSALKPVETESINNLAGAGYQAHEDAVLEKLREKV